MSAKTLMIQGTASSVGKSIIVAALCRIFRQDGFKVAPFKSQNMALNSFVTREGGEIGRAQAVQAEAAGIDPTVDMNPVLLKPEADARSQVIVLGKVWKNLAARDYYKYTPELVGIIEKSLARLRANFDIIVIEGAGSPAEINLKEQEIVNMRVARMAEAPVLLVGDIDRGGVFASIIGTLELLDEAERKMVAGLIINKFRGDVSLLKPGLDILEQKSGKPVLGVVPYFRDLKVAQEDSVWLEERRDVAELSGLNVAATSRLNVAIVRLPHMSNYDDFDPLDASGCSVRYISDADELGSPDLIILPGTKTTVYDLDFLRKQGLAEVIVRRVKEGTSLIGICGGYQMLGKKIYDPHNVESPETVVDGLGLLDMETTFADTKTTTQVKARVSAGRGLLSGLNGLEISGYEIHMGQTKSSEGYAPLQVVKTPDNRAAYFDGTINEDGNIFGTYIHGLFHNAAFTKAILDRLRERCGLSQNVPGFLDIEEQYDVLARGIRESLDMRRLYEIAGLNPGERY
jgi:adenosylcobyric acid synthase